MEWERIQKRPRTVRAQTCCTTRNAPQYSRGRKHLRWLDGLPGGGLNIAHEAIDRHVLAGRGDKLTLRWIGRDDRIRDFSLRGAKGACQSVANVLAQRDIAKNAIVCLPPWAGP